MMRGRFRYCILLITFFCLTAISSNYIIINFTFICMSREVRGTVAVTEELQNITFLARERRDITPIEGEHDRPNYDYSASEKSAIIWAVAAGTIIGTFPVNWLYVKYGAKYPFFVAGVLSAASTALLPLAATLNWHLLLALRFVQGVAYAADFAAIGLVVVRWAPLSEAGVFISVLTSFTPVASVITNPVSAAFCNSSLGWRWSFYAHAVVCLLLFMLWIVVYNDDPQHHTMVSPRELSHIQLDKTRAHIERNSFVPYKAIIRNPTILVVWLNAFSELVSVTLLLTYAPIFFHSVLGFDVTLTGTLASLAACVHLPFKIIPAYLSDSIKSFSERSKMRFFNSIALGASGVFCAVIGFIPQPVLGFLFFTIIFTLMGANCGGFYKCATLVSRQYAHFVLACIQFTKCLSLFVGPGLVALFVHDESALSQWMPVYMTIGICMFVSNLLFYWMCSAEPAPFTLMTMENPEGKDLEKVHPIEDVHKKASFDSIELEKRN